LNLDCVFQTFPQLETSRLRLRQLRLVDAAALFAILSDKAVTRFYDDEPFTEISQAREQIEAWNSGYDARRCIRWGIARKEDDLVVGTCGYYGFHTWHGRASLGYELARPYWRQGMMTEAMGAVIGFGFGQMELNRVQAVVMPGNVGSERLLEKLGFQREGILREYEHWGDKGHVDVTMFSLLRCEYDQ